MKALFSPRKINIFSRVRLLGVLFIVPFAFLMFSLAFLNANENIKNAKKMHTEQTYETSMTRRGI